MEDIEFQKIIGDIKENKLEVLRLISGISIRVSFHLSRLHSL
ncbi:MAG: hypothetical protein K0Q51_885 [Rickettsiaceae bacterium]|jgi:hypothetical protein|nr:hypothetical protein [Rickettsiaceae bacterium]